MVDSLTSGADEGRGVTTICLGEASSSLWSGDLRMGKPSSALSGVTVPMPTLFPMLRIEPNFRYDFPEVGGKITGNLATVLLLKYRHRVENSLKVVLQCRPTF